MKTQIRGKYHHSKVAAAVLSAVALIAAGGIARADDPVTMAPPVQAAAPAAATGSDADNASPDSVFQWTEVPVNQKVPLTRATFDQGGYQLFDTVGETIIIPFTNDNLYVMKFAPTNDKTMYFVNDGNEPVLYVPKNGYLENASVTGGRWYPFSQSDTPSQPVYEGPAPSWSAFVGMGWYSGMTIYGGYWSNEPFVSGAVFLPSAGFSVAIGTHSYSGWGAYVGFTVGHPAPFHLTAVDADIYHRPAFSDPEHEVFFHGEHVGGGHRENWFHRTFREGGNFFGGRGHGGRWH